MKGMRLLGMPFGSSPMRPLLCAPTGLKYRSSTTFHELSDLTRGQPRGKRAKGKAGGEAGSGLGMISAR